MDFDGDGRLDLLSGSNCCDSEGFHLFRRNANGSWAPRQRLQLPYPNDALSRQLSFVTAADWNGDGVPDLLWLAPAAQWQQGIQVAYGPFQENEPIGPAHEIDFTPKGYVLDFAVANWDRDGKPGLLVRQKLPNPYGKEGIYWYKNVGGAGRPKLAEGKLLMGEAALGVQNSSDASTKVEGFCVCDWNGDGWPDLIVTRADASEARGQA